HDSQARFPQPKCSVGTREGILRKLLTWALLSLSWKVPGICWLRGSAGTGKSAIAQTIAEACEGKELLATFFFSRADPNRNNARYLALAIADAITIAVPSLRDPIFQAFHSKQEIFHASLEGQFKALIIEPLLKGKNHSQGSHSTSYEIAASSTLVIIDGLDECVATNEQQQILSLMLQIMRLKLPIHFLVCSCPELQIQDRFNQEDLSQFTKFMSLNGDPNVNQDIEIMLHTEFSKICRSSRCKRMVFPDPWPSKRDLQTLVDKSSGQFIYAATILKF
ncbi:hypothetical protein L218DRAFT_843551, partial [Marasmius fiardii PR-910]